MSERGHYKLPNESVKVFGMQLYKDVDSDHQQKMLNSNIYIPDVDSETKGHEKSFELT